MTYHLEPTTYYLPTPYHPQPRYLLQLTTYLLPTNGHHITALLRRPKAQIIIILLPTTYNLGTSYILLTSTY